MNIISAFLLKDDHSHHHDHPGGHHHHDHVEGHHHDHNLSAAYMHVLADALTSLLAIVALVTGKYFGWSWLDPMMGIVGAIIIMRWAYGLLLKTSPILLDGSVEADYLSAIKDAIEADSDNRVSDLHVWRVSSSHYAAIISLVTHEPRPAEYYKARLKEFNKISHLSIEVNKCEDEACS